MFNNGSAIFSYGKFYCEPEAKNERTVKVSELIEIKTLEEYVKCSDNSENNVGVLVSEW